ncbi:MAG TPA: histidine kinase [Burkholderiales bacterium]|nr:histidine kinase [Burkholderiales bacterium]
MQSIRQNDLPDALPDFRNLGVMSRVLLSVNALALLIALARSREIGEFAARVTEIAGSLEPVLLGVVIVLYAGSTLLERLAYVHGLLAVFGIVLAVTAAFFPFQPEIDGSGEWRRELVWSLGYAVLGTGVVAWYFHLRNRAFSPTISEARLQALQARIRPHFLFNSLNAVLSLIRKDPKRAEAALEDLSELFRTAMADNHELIALRDELTLCRQYLNLEQLRLGERLRVQWRLDPTVEEALVPPMLLQPLVENAVYHGIEPGIGPGLIEVHIERRDDRLRLKLTNPYHEEYHHRQGNRMALANIRERLQLHFDVEASLDTRIADGRFEIDIVMPYRTSL